MESEIWKDIPQFRGFYQVSNLGRVRSLDRYLPGKLGSKHFVKGTILKPALTSRKEGRGYYRVALSGKFYLVHRLVWEAFNGPIPEGYEVNHIDEDKLNNRLENLNLMTPKENNCWGTRIIRQKEKVKNGKTSKKVLQYDLDGNFIREWVSQHEIERELKIQQSYISRVCTGLRHTAGGYIWRFKDKEVV